MESAGRILLGFVLGAGVFLPFGWLVGLAFSPLGFRRASLGQRLAMAVLLTVAALPIALHLAGRLISPAAAAWLVRGALAGAIGALAAEVAISPARLREGLLALVRRPLPLVAALGTALAFAAALVQFEARGELRTSLTAFDYAKHVGVTDAIARTGYPPENPFFHPGKPVVLHYYWLWHALCAEAHALSGGLLSTYEAVAACTAWAAVALGALLATWIRVAPPAGVRTLGGRAGRVAVGLLLVTGLDLAMTVLARVVSAGAGPWPQTGEWWNEQVSAWVEAVIWAPHHVAGFVAGCVGFLAVREAAKGASGRAGAIATAGLAFASAAGLSIWTTLVAVGISLAWLADRLVRRRGSEAAMLLAAGLLATALAAPFLRDLAASDDRRGSPVAFDVRRFQPIERRLDRLGVSEAPAVRWPIALAALPLNYGIELGFFGLAAALYLRARRRGALAGLSREDADADADDERFRAIACATSLVICTFVRSAIRENDLGWRGLLFAQAVLLLWSVPVAAALLARRRPGAEAFAFRPSRLVRAALAAALVLGVAGTVYNSVALRTAALGADALGVREAYAWVRASTGRDQVLQHAPPGGVDILFGLYAGRAAGVADGHTSVIFGVSVERHAEAMALARRPFDAGASWEDACRAAARLGIDWWVVRRGDPILEREDGWARTRPAAFENGAARVIRAERARP